MRILSPWFWNTLNQWAGLGAVFILFFLIIFQANIEIKDLDLWLHLGMGKYILTHATVPDVDVLSATIAGKPWINHEWLFQVIVYWLYQLGDFDALITLQVLVVGLTFVFLFLFGYSKENQWPQIFALLLVLLVYQLRFTLRPDIFSLFFFTLFIVILGTQLEKRISIVLLFLIQAFWNNMHGFFILGPLVILINLFAEYAKRHWSLPKQWREVGKLNDQEYKNLKIIGVSIFIACLFNPYFIRGALYPLQVLVSLPSDSKIFFEYIVELQRPIGSLASLFSLHQYGAYKLLIWLSAGSFVLNYRKLDIGLLLFWLVFFVFSLLAVRNIVFFAIAAYVVFLSNIYHISFSRIVRFGDKNFPQILSIGVKVILMLWMINHIRTSSLHGYFDFDKWERKSEFGGVSLRNYPYKAVDFLAQNRIRGNFLNDFNSGAYLVGRTFPGIKVFIDGRTEVYGASFFKEYRKIFKGDIAVFNQAVNEYKLTGVFLNSVYSPIPAKLSRYLYNNPDWALVYFDYDAAIFLKNIPENEHWIKRHKMDLSKWDVTQMDLIKLGVQDAVPYRHIFRAQAFFNLNILDKAQQEISEALKISPKEVETYLLIGKINMRNREYDQAFENFRKAKVLNPSDLLVKYYLASSLYQLDELDRAREQVQGLIDRDAKNSKALYLMALILTKQRNYDQADGTFKRAYALKPDFVNDVVRIGDLLMTQNEYQRAIEVFEMAIKAQQRGEIHKKIGQAYELLGKPELAQKEFSKACELRESPEEDLFDSDPFDELD